jgi:hypothetical protein
MSLRYACFLSYQRGNDLVDRFARELFHALSNELELHTDLKPWFDTARIEPGEIWTDQVVEALSSSVCLVPIVTPAYFSAERLYCTREFMGMQKIQAFRIGQTKRQDSLILPVVLRGAERLAPAFKSITSYDFSDYFALGPQQIVPKAFFQLVRDMGKRISRLCETYGGLDQAAAPRFELPSQDETRNWLARFEQTIRVPSIERGGG